MVDIQVAKVTDIGDDVLLVEGTAGGETTSVTGWVSAMSNYFPPESYTEDGHLLEGAVPREMTQDEKLAYWQSLILTTVPVKPSVEPVVLFEAPQ